MNLWCYNLVIKATFYTTLQNSPVQLVFGTNMLSVFTLETYQTYKVKKSVENGRDNPKHTEHDNQIGNKAL